MSENEVVGQCQTEPGVLGPSPGWEDGRNPRLGPLLWQLPRASVAGEGPGWAVPPAPPSISLLALHLLWGPKWYMVQTLILSLSWLVVCMLEYSRLS